MLTICSLNFFLDILKEIIPAFERKGTADFKCPHKLYIIIPKSCNAGNVVEDNNGRIVNFTKTAPIYPFGNKRSVISNIYKVSSSSFFRKKVYSVNQVLFVWPNTLRFYFANLKLT